MCCMEVVIVRHHISKFSDSMHCGENAETADPVSNANNDTDIDNNTLYYMLYVRHHHRCLKP